MKWYPFDAAKGYRQKRPTERKLVLVRLAPTSRGLPCVMAVGYRRDGGGDKNSPFFVIPGIGGEVIEWCDCLPEEFGFEDYRTGRAKLAEASQ